MPAAAQCDVWRRHADSVNRTLVERWLPQRARVVLKTDSFDEAVGDGLSAILRPRCSVLIDISPRMLATARSRHAGLACAAMDVCKLGLRSGSVDAVISASTLDHFTGPGDIRSALAELRRILKPRGTLILTLDNRGNPAIALRNAFPKFWQRVGVAPYQMGYTCGRRSLRRLLENESFEVCDTTSILHCPRAAAIPLCRAFPAVARVLPAFESMDLLPTRFLTGYFIAARCLAR
jgi:SAM-dependent methyltransferase